jgi:hypothetical protein
MVCFALFLIKPRHVFRTKKNQIKRIYMCQNKKANCNYFLLLLLDGSYVVDVIVFAPPIMTWLVSFCSCRGIVHMQDEMTT